MKHRIQALLAVAASVAVGLFAAPVQAQEGYPARPVTIIVPFPAGGISDVITRILADSLSTQLDGTFVVENRPGAGGIVGSTAGAQAAPDGYTLVVTNLGTHVLAPLLADGVTYDPIKSFTPISTIVSLPFVLTVSADSGIKTLEDLKAKAEEAEKQGKVLTYAAAGAANADNYSATLLTNAIGVKAQRVVYPGAAPSINAVISGEVDFHMTMITDAVPQVTGGKLNPIVMSTLDRYPFLPDYAALSDFGLNEPNVQNWFGLMGPAGMPDDIVAKLNAAVQVALEDPRFAATGLADFSLPGTADDFAVYLKEQSDRFRSQVDTYRDVLK